VPGVSLFPTISSRTSRPSDGEHIALTGDYIWNGSNPSTDFRPLRDVHTAFLAKKRASMPFRSTSTATATATATLTSSDTLTGRSGTPWAEFAPDSPLEEAGFERSVPVARDRFDLELFGAA